ncbi:hypothetical protein N1851_022120 [Merluccius polli]|uniref:Uncharacterized protein n=1 Tax=Merluccius polli TaxID=89951 RepID=A0AA47MIR0_MERPO|nr:hypothetical protein N1851_022120 [Merluccius polli]
MGPLEVFHSTLLKYGPKRQALSYMGMKERDQLTVLEHMKTLHKRAFCKRSNMVVKKIYAPHTFFFLDRLMEMVTARRLDPSVPYKLSPQCLSSRNLCCQQILLLYRHLHYKRQ